MGFSFFMGCGNFRSGCDMLFSIGNCIYYWSLCTDVSTCVFAAYISLKRFHIRGAVLRMEYRSW